jgi:glycosyltransferase involved in cell wall biosynthesis
MARKLTLVIHALNSGGAERVLVDMANHWCNQGEEVCLITLDTVQTDAFPVDPRVRRIGLGLMGRSNWPWQAIWRNVARIRRLRQAIRGTDPTWVISFTDKMNVLTLLASLRSPWKVVIAERNDPRRQWMGPGWEWLRRRTYPRCHSLVVQTQIVANHLERIVRGRPVVVIPNAVRRPDRVGDGERRPQIVAMGRLTAQKGFDLLLQAFAEIASFHRDWTLQILGEGEAHDELTRLAARLGIADRVEWAGWIEQPESILRQASIFALSSRYEGFPNALLEAMACGLACVSFRCDSGPAEIIQDGMDGLLVPAEDIRGLAAALDRLITDAEFRRKLGENATRNVERFGFEPFFRRWEAVLCESLHR